MKIKKTVMSLTALAICLALLWAASGMVVRTRAQGGGPRPQAVVTPLLQYQGRLTDPATGQPKPDGMYPMSFRLYNVEAGGSPLWTETKNVSVSGGLFSTLLGDTTSLDQDLFNGQALWLGVTVSSDLEAIPRQKVLPVVYALSLVPGAVISSTSSSPVLRVNNTGSGEALHVGGPTVLSGNLTVSGNLTGGSHTHSGGDITTGTVNEARIDSEIARDSEVTSAIGTHASDPDAHHSRYTDVEAWKAILDRSGSGSGLDADLLDGLHASAFATAGHIHDDRYYTEGESDGRFVNVTGPEGISGSSVDPILNVVQSGPGMGGYFTSTTSYGVRGETASTSYGQAGVLGVAGWSGITPAAQVGVLGKSSSGMGVSGVSDSYVGVYGHSASSYGVFGSAAGNDAAVYGVNEGSGYGVQGYSRNSHGVYGDGGSGAGVYSGYFTDGWGGVAGFGGAGYGGYFNSSGGTALYAAGNATVSGNLTTDKVIYSSPRTQYFMVGGEGFVPGSSVISYQNTYGMGGACIQSGSSGALVAPVHLPQGATVTAFKVFFNDTSANNITVDLHRLSLTTGGYTTMASVSSSGVSGYGSVTDTTITLPTIDNITGSYHVYAYWGTGDCNIKVMGALVTYTVSEAQ